MNQFTYTSPYGNILIREDNEILEELTFSYSEFMYKDSSSIIDKCINQLDEYFQGKRKAFDLPLNIVGTDFQKSVWEEVGRVPYGKTSSYSAIAKQLNNYGAIRAIGAANGKNKFHIIIPCHRIIGADGSLTGYAGGLEVKKQLLKFEGSLSTKQTKLF